MRSRILRVSFLKRILTPGIPTPAGGSSTGGNSAPGAASTGTIDAGVGEETIRGRPHLRGSFSNGDLLDEARRLYATLHNEVLRYKASEVEEILKDLDTSLSQIRSYEKHPENLPALDSAVSIARTALVKLKDLPPREGVRSLTMGVLLVGEIGLVYAFLHVLSSWRWAWPPFEVAPWTGGAFYADAFFVALFGAIASWMLYAGGHMGKTPISLLDVRTLTRLTASPFMAVVLVALFSELTIGVGSGVATADVGAMTLRGAPDGLRLAFAFLFGFFGEVSIGILRNFVSGSEPAT